MAHISRITIEGYRSIGDRCEILLPRNMPLVLIGENNAGKSNIIKALDVVLGEFWPGNRDVEDHEFFDRQTEETTITIQVFADGLRHDDGPIDSFLWRCRADRRREPYFRVITADGEARWPNSELRQQCQAMIVGADRRLSYQLSYASKRTFLSRLMRRFHVALVADPARVERLKGELGRIVEIFDEVPEFGQFRESLVEQFDAMVAGMTYALNVDFSAYDPSAFFHSLRVYPNEGGTTRTFDELGTGQEQILALVFAHAYAKAFYGGIVLVIEEPEAHLHPLAQEWLGHTIRRMAADGLQIILTTHSPAFVDLLGLAGIALVRKLTRSTIIQQLTPERLADLCVSLGSDAERTDPNTILPYYANGATSQILAGLFARRVVLVEGPTESLSLPIYLRRVGLDVLALGIAIIPVGGKGSLAKWWRFFQAYRIPVYVIFDNDRGDDRTGSKRSDILRTLGMDAERTTALLAETACLLEPTFAIFGVDFEDTFRTLFPGYGTLEERAATEMGGDSKPLHARFIAQRIDVDQDSAGRRVLNLLAGKIADVEAVALEV